MRRVVRRRGRPIALVVVGLTVVASAVAGCTSGSESQVRASSVYEGVVRWFAADRLDDPEPLPIFVEPRGEGTGFDLDVQAELVAAVADVADVRFIDARDEALDTDDEGVVTVRDEGILIRLGPVLEEGRRVSVDVDVFVDEDTDERWTLSLLVTGDSWRVLGDPTPYAEG